MRKYLMMLVAAGMLSGMLMVGGCGGGGSDSAAVDTTPTVAVTGAGTVTDGGSTIDTTYNFTAGTYTYSIAGFGDGDVLSFPAGEVASIFNESYTDGKVLVTKVSNSQTITVELTGLSAADDVKLNFISDLNTVFGTGTIL